MYTIILYVALCSSPINCQAYEPVSWTATTHEGVITSLVECSNIERGFMAMRAYKESDCYVLDTKQ